jgi:hypothetical protein
VVALAEDRAARTPGCQIGYMDHTGAHQLVLSTIRPTRVVGLSLPGGVRLVTWTILAVIDALDFKNNVVKMRVGEVPTPAGRSMR